jgi:hypothetical protein
MNQEIIEKSVDLATIQNESTVFRIVDRNSSQFQNRSINENEMIVNDGSAYYTAKLINDEVMPSRTIGKLFHADCYFESESGSDILLIDSIVPAQLKHIMTFYNLTLSDEHLVESEHVHPFDIIDNIESPAFKPIISKFERLRMHVHEEPEVFSIAHQNYTCDLQSIIMSIDRLEIRNTYEKDLLCVGAYIYFIFRSYDQALKNHGKVKEHDEVAMSLLNSALVECFIENKALGFRLREFANAGAAKSSITEPAYSGAVALIIDLHCLYYPELTKRMREIRALKRMGYY